MGGKKDTDFISVATATVPPLLRMKKPAKLLSTIPPVPLELTAF